MKMTGVAKTYVTEPEGKKSIAKFDTGLNPVNTSMNISSVPTFNNPAP